MEDVDEGDVVGWARRELLGLRDWRRLARRESSRSIATRRHEQVRAGSGESGAVQWGERCCRGSGQGQRGTGGRGSGFNWLVGRSG